MTRFDLIAKCREALRQADDKAGEFENDTRQLLAWQPVDHPRQVHWQQEHASTRKVREWLRLSRCGLASLSVAELRRIYKAARKCEGTFKAKCASMYNAASRGEVFGGWLCADDLAPKPDALDTQ